MGFSLVMAAQVRSTLRRWNSSRNWRICAYVVLLALPTIFSNTSVSETNTCSSCNTVAGRTPSCSSSPAAPVRSARCRAQRALVSAQRVQVQLAQQEEQVLEVRQHVGQEQARKGGAAEALVHRLQVVHDPQRVHLLHRRLFVDDISSHFAGVRGTNA